MANAFALITKYMQNAIDTVFMQESKTKILENGSKYIDLNFQEVGYVKIMSLLMDGLSDYYRVNHDPLSGTSSYAHYNASGTGSERDGYKVGNAEGTWELFKLEYDRGRQFQVDNMDNEETAGLVIGNLLTEFLRTKVVPEVDAVRFSKMAQKCSVSLGNYHSETIGANAIIGKFNEASEWLTEHEVPAEEQVIFVNPSIMTMIKNTTELHKHLSQAELKGDVSMTVLTYDGKPIIEVPTNRFFTNVVVGSNGYYAGTSSKVINFMIVSKKAIVPIVKLNKSKVWTPEQVQDFDGYKVNFRLYHDVIIPKNKIPGIYCSVASTNATTKTNLLSVDLSIKDSKYYMNAYYTNPNGILGTVVNSSTAFTVGTTYETSSTIQEVGIGQAFEKFGTETKQYFALLDSEGKALAVSGEVTLPTA